MTCAFYYTIIINDITNDDVTIVTAVFAAYGLNPESDEDCISTSEVITLPSSTSNDAFHDEFADAVWSAIGRYVPLEMSHTYVEEPECFVRFDEEQYAEWRLQGEENENTETSAPPGAHAN